MLVGTSSVRHRLAPVIVTLLTLVGSVQIGISPSSADSEQSLIAVDSGGFSCALVIHEAVQCWGENPGGPMPSVPNDNAINLDVGYDSACLVTENMQLKCWGYNPHNELSVPSDLGNVKSISMWMVDGCVVTESNLVRCWGWNDSGEASVPSNLGPVQMVTSGRYVSCAISLDGSLKCWGRASLSAFPTSVERPIAVDAGEENVCAIDETRGVVCWGLNGAINAVPDLPHAAVQVKVGHENACALLDSGEVQCWGINPLINLTPIRGLDGFKSISLGWNHACAVHIMGVTCWGDNSHGQATVPTSLQFEPLSKIKVFGGPSKLSVSWDAVIPLNPSSPVTYKASAGSDALSCTTTGTYCDITGLTNGQTYSVTVTASDGTYVSRPSVPVVAIPINPLVAAREGNKQVSLEVNKDCLGGVPANFQYSTNGGFDWKAAVFDRNSNQIVVNSLLNDVTYAVAFRALYSGRFICDSEVVSVTPHVPVGVPGKMKINSVVLSRSNPSALVNAGFLSNSKVPLGYVEYTLNGGQSWTRFSGIRSPFRISDGLTSNSSNSLQIRAVSRDGKGQISDPFQFAIPDMKPGKVAIQNVKPLQRSFVLNLKLVAPIVNGPSDVNVYIDGNVVRLPAKSPAIIPAEFVNFQRLEVHTVQVSLINGWGEGPKSSSVTFKTQ